MKCFALSLGGLLLIMCGNAIWGEGGALAFVVGTCLVASGIFMIQESAAK